MKPVATALKRLRLSRDDFELVKVIGRGAFGEVCVVRASFMQVTFVIYMYVLLIDRSPLERIKYLFTFIYIHSGVEAKRGVEFRHLTRNASRTRQKVGKCVS